MIWFHITTYSWKSKHKSRYSIKEEPGEHSRQQQRCSNAEGRTMENKNNGWNYNVEKEQCNRENGVSKGNPVKWDKGTESDTRVKDEQAWKDNGM